MVYEVVKNRVEDEAIEANYCNDDLTFIDTIEGNHFGIPVHKRNAPSCYQYNVLIMLAKRLIKEDEQRTNIFTNRLHLDRKLTKRIFSSEE
jgi:hypothetical protein